MSLKMEKWGNSYLSQKGLHQKIIEGEKEDFSRMKIYNPDEEWQRQEVLFKTKQANIIEAREKNIMISNLIFLKL